MPFRIAVWVFSFWGAAGLVWCVVFSRMAAEAQDTNIILAVIMFSLVWIGGLAFLGLGAVLLRIPAVPRS